MPTITKLLFGDQVNRYAWDIEKSAIVYSTYEQAAERLIGLRDWLNATSALDFAAANVLDSMIDRMFKAARDPLYADKLQDFLSQAIVSLKE